jgi:hypothetical protein
VSPNGDARAGTGRGLHAARPERPHLLERPLPVAAAPGAGGCGREAFLHAVANGSAVSWQHINLLGEYDFSDEKRQDTGRITPPNLMG